MDEVDALARWMHNLDIGDINYSVCYSQLACLSPAAANAWATPRTHQLCSNVSTAPPVPSSAPLLPKQCLFCRQSHYLRYCQVAAEYLRTGHIIHENLFLLNPNSSHAQSATSSTPSSNSPPTTIPSSAFISESYFFQCTRITENHAMVTTVEDDDSGADTLAITHSKATSSPSSSCAHQQTHSINVPLPDVPLAPPKKTPAYVYESKAAIPDAASRTYQSMLKMAVPNVMITDLLAVSSDLRREAVKHSVIPVPPPQIEHATPLRELKVMLNGIHTEMALLDEGLELVIIREDIWKKTQAPINKDICMHMQTADRGSQDMSGCLKMLEIDVNSIKTWVLSYTIYPVTDPMIWISDPIQIR
ncbi:hypothetical protein DFJ58DRAFT_732923 [Suillus subalutaceus]|uniref:uncharacterized protein n=1 Tax=Suillus subalutaceus TaxID=48586 RepID=UPI001B8692BC|nr:uncharacterized protein DFJ58DRAFT_732923 [Suillus subalutaceus]KAG1840390.1 hypothetical protein DFJ58DRAFT_732923 [Suillus subalutaceus]